MVYETEVSSLQPDPVLLSVPGLRDRGTVFVDSKPVGVLSRFSVSCKLDYRYFKDLFKI